MIRDTENMKDDMIRMFYEFDMDEYNNREARRIIEATSMKNKRLQRELRESKAQVKRLEEKLTRKRTQSYTDIYINMESRYYFLNENSLRSLATAEYIFTNEREAFDYTGVFLNYIKAFEIQIRERLDRSKGLTLGQLMVRLKDIPELKTFVEALTKVKLIDIRNYGVHNGGISKIQCGSLRNILITNRWLDRVCYILNDLEERAEKCEYKLYVEEYLGKEKYQGGHYMCFSTDSGYILSKEYIERGEVSGQGVEVCIRGIDYIVV